MATTGEGVTISSAQLFGLLHGRVYRQLADLEAAVHEVAWQSYPRFRPSSLFNAQNYTEWAIKQGWVERRNDGQFVVVV